jgi:arginine/lysine/ornithine decarboxylase
MDTEPPSQTLTVTTNQDQSPFLDSLLHEQAEHPISFHMPGHKFNPALNPRLTDYWGGDLYRADIVEIGGNIDYLHAPKGALLEAQQLAAQAYGADRSFFLINGSTVGNLAAIMTGAHEGQKVILPRASHRSVYGGLILSGAVPVYIPPVYHPLVNFPLAVEVDTVKGLLEQHPDTRAIHITAPNYYGFCSDVAGLVNLAHEHGIPLLVDEAHGAHFAFHPDLPPSAVQLGADVVVQSMHKTLGALTQASILHVNEGRINVAELSQILTLLQSSSPSSLLTASLDAARQQMAVHGRELLDNALRLAHHVREEIGAIDGLWCYGEDLVGEYGIHTFDPTKLVIRVSDTGLTGAQFAKLLRTRFLVEIEFADPKHIICSITVADSDEHADLLIRALRTLASEHHQQGLTQGPETDSASPALPQMAMNPRQAYFSPSKRVRLEDAIGAVCAENIIPYPPGIPLLMPGEIIDADMVAYLQYVIRKGIAIVGPEDLRVEYVRVIE